MSAMIAATGARFEERFSRVVTVSNGWLNGEAVEPDAHLHDDDEVALKPPVSAG